MRIAHSKAADWRQSSASLETLKKGIGVILTVEEVQRMANDHTIFQVAADDEAAKGLAGDER